VKIFSCQVFWPASHLFRQDRIALAKGQRQLAMLLRVLKASNTGARTSDVSNKLGLRQGPVALSMLGASRDLYIARGQGIVSFSFFPSDRFAGCHYSTIL